MWSYHVAEELATSARFIGNGYVELSRQLLPHTRNINETIELSITTTLPNGLVFWQGQTPTTPGRGKDFLAIAVSDGHVIFRYVHVAQHPK